METETKIGVVSTRETANKSQEDKFKNTIAFLKTAIAEGAHFRVPKGIKTNHWEEYVNVTAVYILNPDETLEDVGKIYGNKTRESMRQTRDKTLRGLWENCSAETQTLFPYGELLRKKPLSQRSKELMSNARGGRSALVYRELQSDKSIEVIRKETGLSSKQVSASRIVLRRWDIESPFLNTSRSGNPTLEMKLKSTELDSEKQVFLNQVKYGFYQKHVCVDNPLLMRARDVFEEAGFSYGFQNQNFAILLAYLERVNFPIGKVQVKRTSKTGQEYFSRYHFILAKDKKRVKQILLADPNLEQFKRSQPKATSSPTLDREDQRF